MMMMIMATESAKSDLQPFVYIFFRELGALMYHSCVFLLKSACDVSEISNGCGWVRRKYVASWESISVEICGSKGCFNPNVQEKMI